MPYTFEGSTISVAHEPRLKDGTMWVPLRSMATPLGGSADWDPDNKVAILYFGSHMVTVKIGDATIDVDGRQVQLREAPYVENGETWVPVRVFSDGLGLNLDVDTAANSVSLRS